MNKRIKIDKEAMHKAIAETREHLDDIKTGLDKEDLVYDTSRKGLQGWLDNNKRWIELCIIVALYWTGNPAIATLMLTLYIVDTM